MVDTLIDFFLRESDRLLLGRLASKIGMLDHRSIQIGLSGTVSDTWANVCVVGIEYMTEKSRKLKKVVDEDSKIEVEELLKTGLMPEEKAYEIPEELRKVLQMDER